MNVEHVTKHPGTSMRDDGGNRTGVLASPAIERERDQLTDRLNDAYAMSLVDAADYRDLLDLIFHAHSRAELQLIAQDVPHLDVVLPEDGGHPSPDWRVRLMAWTALCGTAGIAIFIIMFVLFSPHT